jgi:hypothetical protein
MLPYVCLGIIITLFELYLHPFSEIWNDLSSRLFNYGAMWLLCFVVIFVINRYVPWIINQQKKTVLSGDLKPYIRTYKNRNVNI